MKTDLPDGWHPIRGDGLAGDPDRRYLGCNPNGQGQRWFYYAQVFNGKIVKMNGWVLPEQLFSGTAEHAKFCFKFQGEDFIYDLLPKKNDWADALELE